MFRNPTSLKHIFSTVEVSAMICRSLSATGKQDFFKKKSSEEILCGPSGLPGQSPLCSACFKQKFLLKKIKFEQRNKKKNWFVFTAFSIHFIFLKYNLVLKVFFTFCMCMPCTVVLPVGFFCKLLTHLLIQKVKKAKQAHLSLPISTAMTG